MIGVKVEGDMARKSELLLRSTLVRDLSADDGTNEDLRVGGKSSCGW